MSFKDLYLSIKIELELPRHSVYGRRLIGEHVMRSDMLNVIRLIIDECMTHSDNYTVSTFSDRNSEFFMLVDDKLTGDREAQVVCEHGETRIVILNEQHKYYISAISDIQYHDIIKHLNDEHKCWLILQGANI